MSTLFETAYLTITWLEEIKIIQQTWRGYVESEKFRSGVEKGLELAGQKRPQAWLIDISQSRLISLADQDWLTSQIIPRIDTLGIKQLAYVLPKDVLAQMAFGRVRKTAEANPPKVAFRFFETADEALEWLKQPAQ